MRSENYKNAIISEFKRIINDKSSNNNGYILDNDEEDIKKAFDGTKIKDNSKWFYIQKF
jgi:hypothetical protein